MSKTNNKGKKEKVNSKLILAIVAVIVVVVIIASVVILNKGKDKGVSTELNTEVWLNVNEDATLENNGDKITLKIDSDLNYTEGTEYEVPYILTVNETEYKGTYTFATGYSIHSEPNDIPYKVSFTGIKPGSIGVRVSAK